MNKNRIRLTESQLHRVIKESVKKVLREGIFPKVGRMTSSYNSDNIPYDDDWVDKYGSGGIHSQSEWEGEINQSIPNEVHGLAQRVENLGLRMFGTDCIDIDVSADRNDEFVESGDVFGTDTTFRGIISIYVSREDFIRKTFRQEETRINFDSVFKKFIKLVNSMFNQYCNDVNITTNRV